MFTFSVPIKIAVSHFSKEDIEVTLKRYFGYDSFRPHQYEIIKRTLEGHDSIVLMPTGGGKSICFQLPSLLMEGTALVISPLISLMKDQVESLRSNGILAAYFNSSQNYNEQHKVKSALKSGKLKILYVSPEKVLSSRIDALLENAKISLVAIDEAHCISQWGHDFRPEYTRLNQLKLKFPDVPFLGLTATADKITRRDIEKQMMLDDPKLFISSFNRPNLSLAVKAGRGKFQEIQKFIRDKKDESGIIYCLSRKNCESVSAKLNSEGYTSRYYHAGMSADERSKVQEDFINDKIPIICATIAFGMGIDKSNVRFVIHYNLPQNIEGFYQEIGRAGRDGLKSDTLLFFSIADVITIKKFLQDAGQKQLQESKLKRMMEDAEAQICRRRILLSYFGEELLEDSGNCDICLNPPNWIEGKLLVQKALSALVRIDRAEKSVGFNMLIDVLRGSNRRDLLNEGLNKIRTYGAGRNHSFEDWSAYLIQMLQSGFFEIRYDHGSVLKITELGMRVLKDDSSVKMARPLSFVEKLATKESTPKPTSKKEQFDELLYDHLRLLRKELAAKKRVPPYVIFHDTTLSELVEVKPISIEQFSKISGVGDSKLQTYGKFFTDEILKFIVQLSEEGMKVRGSSSLISYSYFQNEMTILDIAEKRNLAPATIASHLTKLSDEGIEIDLKKIVSESEINRVYEAWKKINENKIDISIYKYLEDEMPSYKGNIAYHLLKREGKIIPPSSKKS